MADNLSPERRHAAMQGVKAKDTAPELAVRRLLRANGERGYRLHRKELPGSPDIAFIGRQKAIFVHGCFWHGHDCPRGAREPKANASYWSKKIARNRQRDQEHIKALAALGWTCLVVWECELKAPDSVLKRLAAFLEKRLNR